MEFKNNSLMLGVCCCLLFGCSQPENDGAAQTSVIRPVKLFDVNLSTTQSLEFPGEVEASQQAYLGFRVPGVIQKFHVLSGQRVNKGDLLVELDSTDFKLALDAQQAKYDLTEIQFKRAEILVKDFLLSRSDFDNVRTELAIATADLGTAEANLSYTKVFAPYDGVVAATYKENFEYVSAQEQILSVQNENAIDVVFAAPERLLPVFKRVKDSKNIIKSTVSFPVLKGQQFEAQLKSVDTIADDRTGSFKIKLTMPQPKNATILAGMSANVMIQFDLVDEEFDTQLPQSALISENNSNYVWVVNDQNTLDKVQISLDADGNILSGLKNGDQVVATGVGELTSGQKVKRWVKERGL